MALGDSVHKSDQFCSLGSIIFCRKMRPLGLGLRWERGQEELPLSCLCLELGKCCTTIVRESFFCVYKEVCL